MNSQFKREERYIVVKLKHLAAQQRAPLANFLLTNGIPKVDCLVVEADWPEYEPTWAAIERRMAGQPPVTAAEELEAVLHWRDKHAVAIKERDALQQRLNAVDQRADDLSGMLQHLVDNPYRFTDAYRERIRAALNPNPECCKVSPEDKALLAAGEYTPEELFGIGGKPSCPKCFNRRPEAEIPGSTCNQIREENDLPINSPCKACNGGACIDR